jgi:hypothetical protein
VTPVLHSMQLLPRGEGGWSSPELTFGDSTTLIGGPLGSGKTPLVKALAFALGAPAELPPAVRERCGTIRLIFRGAAGPHILERVIKSDVYARAQSGGEPPQVFEDEKALSAWVLERLGVAGRDFIATSGNSTYSYVSVLAPAFIVDQDTGWAGPYVPLDMYRFVRNQREEVMRWVLDIPARHGVVDKRAYESAKTEQAAIQQTIQVRRRTIEMLTRELGADSVPEAADGLRDRREVVKQQLAAASAVVERLSRTESVLDSRVREAANRRDHLREQVRVLARRRQQLASVQGDVDAEVHALEQNEVAATAFRILCGNENCKFFRQPEESYGRRLLYLKDQLKDFTVSGSGVDAELTHLETALTDAESLVNQAVAEKQQSLQELGAADSMVALEALTREISDISVRLDRLERVTNERRQLDALIDKEARAAERVAELRPMGVRRDTSRLLDARAMLAKAFNEWVRELRIPNVPADAVVDEELRVIIGGERFNPKISHSGSTRTRLVMAFHAALLETSLAMTGNHPPVLVLDAPRQHELSAADVRAFVDRFQRVVAGRAQLVLSATDPNVVTPGEGVRVWLPTYKEGDTIHYLGSADASRGAGHS